MTLNKRTMCRKISVYTLIIEMEDKDSLMLRYILKRKEGIKMKIHENWDDVVIYLVLFSNHINIQYSRTIVVNETWSEDYTKKIIMEKLPNIKEIHFLDEIARGWLPKKLIQTQEL